MNNELDAAYDPEKFRALGHELVDLLADHLNRVQSGEEAVNHWVPPTEQLDFWNDYQLGDASPTALFKTILERSMRVHHPNYMGHQIAPSAPLSALAALMGSLLNNGMAVYEMGAAATAIERVVTDLVARKIGYDQEADGFLTSGGTLANLTALLSARKAMVDADIWKDGMQDKLAVMVSSEAHYCVDRALRIMGFGSQGIIKIPVDDRYKMRTELLEEAHEKAASEGLAVIAVVGSAPSTSTGMHDDLEAIAAFCAAKKLWFHVDGAHGGAAVFSEKYKTLLRGIEQADSVVIDGHKMLMTPSVMTFLLFKNKAHSFATFNQKAQYLLAQSSDEEWYNLAHRTFECTKLMMSIQFYVMQQHYGEQVFDQFVTRVYDMGKTFAQKVKDRPLFELALEPESNIVCYRYCPKKVNEKDLNALNAQIRELLLKDGTFYIVQTTLNEQRYLRNTFMSPHTTAENMDALLDRIEAMGAALVSAL